MASRLSLLTVACSNRVCHITVQYCTVCIVCHSSFLSTVFSSANNAVLIVKSVFSCKAQIMRA